MANVKIPYPMTPAVSTEARRAQSVRAISLDLPRLTRVETPDPRTLHIACFGPSLRETYEQLRGQSPLIAMSGATKFLAERGIIADCAIECDPRSTQVAVSLPPVPGVTYYVASCVQPEFFDALLAAGNQVILWHTVNTHWEDEVAWVAEHDPGQVPIHAGSTVGLAAIHLGRALGFSRFEIHGMDGSFAEDGVRHAAHHAGKTQQPEVTWQALNHVYSTSQIMANAVAETVNVAKNFPITTIWHGQGLTQALIRKAKLQNAACADETEKVAQLRGFANLVAPHAINPRTATYWARLLSFLVPTDLPELVQNISRCEPLRAKAKYNTGTIPFEAAVQLRALARCYQPQVICEVGTFIGTSALALHWSPTVAVDTCDASNDCFQPEDAEAPGIVPYPYQTSTQMLAQLVTPVDLFFFDGRIQLEDLPHIVRLSRPGTVYVCDDYHGTEKGVVNIQRLLPLVGTTHTLVTPSPGLSTLAVLVPSLTPVYDVPTADARQGVLA